MNRFILHTTLFHTPIILIFILLELYACLPKTTFNQKANYINKHNDVSTLILGSSHNQKAFNPEHIDKKAVNLAFGFQDYELDSALLNRYLSKLNKLKYLVLEIDYHSLEYCNQSEYFRYGWYYYYHNINLTNLPIYYRFSLYISSPNFFNKKIQKHKLAIFNQPINKDSFITSNNFKTEYFSRKRYNLEKIIKSAKKRFEKKHISEISTYNFNKNSQILEKMIETCVEKNIIPILVSTPLHKSFYVLKNKKKDLRRKKLIDKLLLKYNSLKYLDLENDSRFNTRDFSDEDHLNVNGSIKTTNILNKTLNTIP
ncbi:MAG: hypothetical protein P1U41_10055 [Vicingaceae bacterium]|nr:hypothetical protein [Vicingaceae bacterium]